MSACAQSTVGLTTQPVLVSESDPDAVSVWGLSLYIFLCLSESIVMHVAQLFIKRFCDFCWPNGVLGCLVLHAMLVKTMPRTMQQQSSSRAVAAAVIQLVSSNGLSPSHKSPAIQSRKQLWLIMTPRKSLHCQQCGRVACILMKCDAINPKNVPRMSLQ